MIFVTVGAQMPFDRLVAAVDRWAGKRARGDVFAQIGESQYQPSNMQFVKNLEPQSFRQKVMQADLIIAHAGMGSILTALEVGKPILVMPRRGDLRETRNDHQVATANKLGAFGRVNVALDEQQLFEKLEQLGHFQVGHQIGPHASQGLLLALREFIVRGRPVVGLHGREEVGLTASEVDLPPHVPAGAVLANG